MNTSLYRWEFYGVFIIFVLFSILHFAYELTGIGFFALFSAVNESVWEHLKIGFFAALFYYVMEYFCFGKDLDNFIFAKSVALYLIPLFIIVTFYGYTAILGKHYLWIDITIAFLSGAVAQYVSYKIINSDVNYYRYQSISIFFLLAAVIVFVVFSFTPPRLPLFLDKSNNKYGI